MSDRPDLFETLRKLGMRVPKEVVEALIRNGTKTKMSSRRFLEQLCEAEQRERETKNLAQRVKTATLSATITADHFDWNHPRKIDKSLYEQLLTLDFVKAGHNVLFRGQAGVGKTTLAANLGHSALQSGHTVKYITLASALAELLKQESMPATERRLKRFTVPDLLILDELGYVPCDARAADLLFNIISRRHEKRSVIITTNLAYKAWGGVFRDASCLSALIDRFAQHCHVVDIDADSWRQKESIRKRKR